MALIEIDEFPSEKITSIYGWDFPWRTVSHNQMVDGMVFGHQSFAGIWIQKDHSFTHNKNWDSRSTMSHRIYLVPNLQSGTP